VEGRGDGSFEDGVCFSVCEFGKRGSEDWVEERGSFLHGMGRSLNGIFDRNHWFEVVEIAKTLLLKSLICGIWVVKVWNEGMRC
jgi:hypothetical protein